MTRKTPCPAADALAAVAERASTLGLGTVVRAAPADRMMIWAAAAVHPLQQLETEVDAIVRDATAGIPDLDTRKSVEAFAMRDYLFAQSGPAQLLGVARGQPYDGVAMPFPEDRLAHAAALLQRAAAAIKTLRWTVQAAPLIAAFETILADARIVRASFPAVAANSGVPTLEAADRWIPAVEGLLTQVKAAPGAVLFQRIRGATKKLLTVLGEALGGVAIARMIYTIEDFYLYRLLIPYSLTTEGMPSADQIAQMSGILTDVTTNGHTWLDPWLRDMVADLAAQIRAADPTGDTLFFLKGGRAIEYMMGDPARGRNDWDTQLVINPTLPPGEWYAVYLRVSNAILLALKGYARAFYVVLNQNARAFASEADARLAQLSQQMVDDAPDAPDAITPPTAMLFDGDDVVPPGSAGCKAELIDISLPRRDTIEIREHWAHLRGHLLSENGIAYPDFTYYVAEYILILREVFAGTSSSAHKAAKRIKRLVGIVEQKAGGIDHAVAAELRQSVPQSFAMLGEPTLHPAAYLLAQILVQFVRSYALTEGTHLARSFDIRFSTLLPQAMGQSFIAFKPDDIHAPFVIDTTTTVFAYPDALLGSIFDTATEDGAWPPTYTAATNALGFAGYLAPLLATTIDDIATEVRTMPLSAALRTALLDLGKTKSWGDGTTIALTGSAAVIAHATALGYRDLRDLTRTTQVDFGIWTTDAALIDTIGNTLEQDLKQGAPGAVIRSSRDATGEIIDVHMSAAAGSLLVARITIAAVGVLPLLTSIAGEPVLGIRDLIVDYTALAPQIEEFTARMRLRRTIAALTTMLTRAIYAVPPDPAIAALTAGTCRYLMLAAAGHEARYEGYPQAIPADRRYVCALTPNRTATRAMLTLGAPGNADRTLDLLVVNNGIGGLGRFADWTPHDIDRDIVVPLSQSGVKARIIVLDFRVSASLLQWFAPLCAIGGKIYAAIYGPEHRIVTTTLWETLAPHGQLTASVDRVLDGRIDAIRWTLPLGTPDPFVVYTPTLNQIVAPDFAPVSRDATIARLARASADYAWEARAILNSLAPLDIQIV